ncbi:MAG: aldo/keto reductase [Deltaproteobacteria bacterium]|nr:aldo/keto reductase [Deltaproteobacteria bacterium]
MTDPEPIELAKRPLGHTGLQVSPLGLAGSHGIDADAAERAFHELGINYFFLTPRMKSMIEAVRRLVKAGHRDELVIAAGAPIPTGGGVHRAWRGLVRKLGVSHIDVFHLWWVQYHWYVTGKTWPAMRELKEQGKATALAISSHDRRMARAMVDELDLDVLMCRYNAAHRGAETDIFESLPERRAGIVSYTATRWGRLLKPAGDLGPMTAGECYRFVLGNPAVDVALCSPRSWDELREDVAAVAAGPLDADRLAEVRAFGDRVHASPGGWIGFVGG